MLKIGDKIKYVKADPFIEMPLGTIMTITDITGTAIAVQGDYKADGSTVGLIKGLMSYDKYEKHFEKIIEEKVEKKNIWTDWMDIEDICCEDLQCSSCPYYYLCDLDMQYKTNGKRIIVKPKGKYDFIKSYATCHKTDTFDLAVGLKVALARLNVKLAQEQLKNIIEQIG